MMMRKEHVLRRAVALALLAACAVTGTRAMAVKGTSGPRSAPVSRRGLSRSLAGLAVLGPLAVPSPGVAAIERNFWNSNALFSEDYYFKNGKLPPRDLESQREIVDTIREKYGLPFVRVQTRYDAYKKYAERIDLCLEGYGALGRAVEAARWDEVTALVAADGDVARGLRPAGMFATIALSPDSVSNEALLMRYYVNETYFQLSKLGDAAAAKDGETAKEAYDVGRSALNSYVWFVNQVINEEKVGRKFRKV